MKLHCLMRVIDSSTPVTISKRVNGHDVIYFVGLKCEIPYSYDDTNIVKVFLDSDDRLRICIKGFVPYLSRPTEPMVDFDFEIHPLSEDIRSIL